MRYGEVSCAGEMLAVDQGTAKPLLPETRLRPLTGMRNASTLSENVLWMREGNRLRWRGGRQGLRRIFFLWRTSVLAGLLRSCQLYKREEKKTNPQGIQYLAAFKQTILKIRWYFVPVSVWACASRHMQDSETLRETLTKHLSAGSAMQSPQENMRSHTAGFGSTPQWCRDGSTPIDAGVRVLLD